MRCSRTGLCGLLLLAGSAAAQPGYEPLAIPRDELHRRVRTIALEPYQPLLGTPQPEAVRARVEARFDGALRRHGFEVLPSHHFESLWRHFSQQLGGIYDPSSGAPDEEKYGVVRDFTLRELATRLGVDALLDAYMGERPLESHITFEFGNRLGYGHWASLGEPLRLGDALIPGAPGNKPQRVVGHSLELQLRDLSDAPLFALACSIQWTRVYVARSYHERTARELHDPARLDEAIAICTEDLAPSLE